jgi:asparagine synthase (glutamine-hydrolysing)
MCGIAGIFSYRFDGAPTDPEALNAISIAMASRGPDGDGCWFAADRTVGLAHRRLAIIDPTSAGAQPMATPDGRLQITFNGEIYNYRELKRELVKRGISFTSNSDTEVLLHLYREFGEGMLKMLRGMFAFAIYDAREKSMFLARDVFGIKPLYFCDNGRCLLFASQVKALRASGLVSNELDPAGQVGFLLWGHVPDPFTVYTGIRALEAGTWLKIKAGGAKCSGEFSSASRVLADLSECVTRPLSVGEAQEQLREALLESVRYHLVSDVPVGVFLSAGLDSSTLAALTKEAGISELKSVTLGFSEFRGTPNDEVPLAGLTANRLGTSHSVCWIGRETFEVEFEQLISCMDQPTIDGVNSYFVSQAARQSGLKVVLSGLGGDELFGGYPSYWQVPTIARTVKALRVPRRLAVAFRKFASILLPHRMSPKYAGVLEYGGDFSRAYLLRRALFMPWELSALVGSRIAEEGLGRLETIRRLQRTVADIAHPRLKIMALEISWYMRHQLLRDADWASMAHSLELRVPFVDLEVLKTTARLALASQAPNKRSMVATTRSALPSAIMVRPKSGFSTPIQQWVEQTTGNDELAASSAIAARGLRRWAIHIQPRFANGRMFWRRAQDGTVAVFRFGQLGDSLVAMPALAALKRRYPHFAWVLVTDRQPRSSGYISSWQIFGPTGWFDRVIFYAPGESRWKWLSTILALTFRLRAIHAVHLFNLAPARSVWQSLRDRLFFTVLCGVDEYRSPLIRRDSAAPSHEAEWLHLLRSVDEGAVPEFNIAIPEQDRQTAAKIAYEGGIEFRRPTLAIGPGSKMPAKKWPAERFEELGLRLLDRFPDLQLCVFGGAEDMELAAHLCAKWGNRSYSVAGHLSPYGSAALLQHCVAYVGNDTGTMHLAGLAGIPCVALFSARDAPGKWEPYGARHAIHRTSGIPCAGCMLVECPFDNECLRRIDLDEVISSCVRFIGARSMNSCETEASDSL